MVVNVPRAEPQVQVIEGRHVIVIQRRPPLQASLELLRRAMVVTWETPLRRTGPRAECLGEQSHRLIHFLSGRHAGLDGIVRDLRLFMCADCEAVCVRDVTHDRLDRLPTGQQPLRRRDRILGWYTGGRPRQRTYSGPQGGRKGTTL